VPHPGVSDPKSPSLFLKKRLGNICSTSRRRRLLRSQFYYKRVSILHPSSACYMSWFQVTEKRRRLHNKELYDLYFMICILWSIFYILYFMLCILWSVFHAMYFIIYISLCILWSLFYVMHFMICILYSVFIICILCYVF
jgi:hypothetical protein